jgi:large subunit ribosomal protein L9e
MDLPEGIKVEIKAKQIRVSGPRGVLTRDFKHLNLDFQLLEGGRQLKVDAWFGTRKTMAAIRTAISHVNNLITGVTKGYRYKMRFVYAHFPINASIGNDKDNIEIRNFLGEKKVRTTPHWGAFRVFGGGQLGDAEADRVLSWIGAI